MLTSSRYPKELGQLAEFSGFHMSWHKAGQCYILAAKAVPCMLRTVEKSVSCVKVTLRLEQLSPPSTPLLTSKHTQFAYHPRGDSKSGRRQGVVTAKVAQTLGTLWTFGFKSFVALSSMSQLISHVSIFVFSSFPPNYSKTGGDPTISTQGDGSCKKGYTKFCLYLSMERNFEIFEKLGGFLCNI